MDPHTLCYWMERFTLEIRKVNGEEYQPNTLHHIICGIMRYVWINGREGIDFFKDAEFAGFRGVLDAEMKRLQTKGLGSSHKQAEPLTIEDEELLWEKKILGDHSPESLLNTMIYMNGLYFALRSGDEHRNLRHSPCQIQLVERPGERAHLKYTEDISKNRPGGLKGRKVKPKVVLHHENNDNPQRCFVRLFKRYISLCPPDSPSTAFYLNPLKKPSESSWYSTTPIGKNKLSKAVSTMCKACGIQGYKTIPPLLPRADLVQQTKIPFHQLVPFASHSPHLVLLQSHTPHFVLQNKCPTQSTSVLQGTMDSHSSRGCLVVSYIPVVFVKKPLGSKCRV